MRKLLALMIAMLVIFGLASFAAAGVVELRQLGDTADQIAQGIVDINKINNTLGPRYDAMLLKARTLTGNQSILLVDLTDNQINIGLLEGRGTAEDIAQTKTTIIGWEIVITTVRGVVVTLPDVNE